MSVYDLTSVQLPRLTGRGLRTFAGVLENSVTNGLLVGRLLRDGGVLKLREVRLDEPPTYMPLALAEATAIRKQMEPVDWERLVEETAVSSTLHTFTHAYQTGETTVTAVADKILAAIDKSDQQATPLRAFIAVNRADVLAQAQASAKRWVEGKPLGPLDGVPIAVKDELDQVPYPTTVGTKFLGRQPAAADSTVVARLRQAGVLLIGKTNMHEIGINPDSSNINHGMARNPHNLAHDAGGSSSGSAAAVAAGFCPVAIGADGGGSVRVPAAHCGLVGLKATFGRISEAGAVPLCWSVAHVGPIGRTVADVVLAYALIAGPDERDPISTHQPPVSVAGWNKGDLEGVVLGIFPDWFDHCTPAIRQTCRALLGRLEEAGATVREVAIPELDLMRIAHALTILSEMAASMDNLGVKAADLAPSTRVNLALGRAATARDYVQAQRMRTRALAHFAQAFAEVDVLVSPTTAVTAPPIPNGGLSDGWSDLSVVTEVMRYVFPANLTGHPALSVPAGVDANGLPIGLHLMGRHWEEHLLFRVGQVVEGLVEKKRPFLHYEIIS